MPTPITVGAARIVLLRAPVVSTGPTSAIVNTSAEMVFNDVGEGLTGP